MITWMIVLFLAGYTCIAMEHPLKIDKAATALLTGMLLWIMYIAYSIHVVPEVSAGEFNHFIQTHSELTNASLWEQCVKFVLEYQIIEHLGEVCEILVFLVGAMTIVELVDVHGGFAIITNRIKTRNKRTLLWLITVLTFFMSAILDNLTTAIVMTMLIRKIVDDQKDRWMFAGMIILAANSGGAWSPIGDVTTIMLWVRGNVSTNALLENLLIPSMVSVLIPLLIMSQTMKGNLPPKENDENSDSFLSWVSKKERISIFVLGVSGLLLVPVYKTIFHIPPFMGVLLSLSFIWVYTEIMYAKKANVEEPEKMRVATVIKKIDGSTLLFFLGILLAVAALQSAGVLESMAQMLDNKLHNVYFVNLLIGLLSSVVDNVPLVAGAIGMYPIATEMSLAASADPAYLANFVQDGIFWQLLTYCAGVGGSILIIGSAAGVVVMGLEKMNFIWYLKKISWIALLGYLAGAATFYLQQVILG
ncbi:MAG: sodium:proton antiporter NhaD [Bacteroidales bacterium]